MSSVVIAGNTSGTVTLLAPDIAGTTTLTLPTTSGTVLTTASGQWITSRSNIYYNAGNVGIGTSSPPLKLSVLSGVTTDNTSTPVLMLGSDRTDYYASINSVRGAASTYLGLAFSTSNNGSPAERMRIDSSGNVGIGTSSPAYKLDVQGTANSTLVSLGTARPFRISSSSDGTNDEAIWNLNATSSVGQIRFSTVNTEAMRIDSSGNLLVGNSSGNARLFVKGSSTSASDLCFMFQNSSASTVLAAYNNGALYADGLKSGAGTNAVKFSTATGQVTYDTSSARYKDNIRDSVYGLDHVMQMRSAQFEYKDDGRSDVGLIAEELQPIVPELVGLNKDGQADSVSYDRMVSVLVKAIQEQQALITDLTTRLTALENK
jgi:hypothetical protein